MLKPLPLPPLAVGKLPALAVAPAALLVPAALLGAPPSLPTLLPGAFPPLEEQASDAKTIGQSQGQWAVRMVIPRWCRAPGRSITFLERMLIIRDLWQQR